MKDWKLALPTNLTAHIGIMPTNDETKNDNYTVTFSNDRYEQLKRLRKLTKTNSNLLVITAALDLLEKAKNI